MAAHACAHHYPRNDPGSHSLRIVRVAGERTGEHALLDQDAPDHERYHKKNWDDGDPGAEREADAQQQQQPTGAAWVTHHSVGSGSTTCWPRSGCKRTALEKKRLTSMAQVVNAMPIAKPIKPRIWSVNGTVADQCSRPTLSPASSNART